MITRGVLSFLILVVFGFLPNSVFSQRDSQLRAVWVATVANVDWPTVRTDADIQERELIALIDSLKSCNINAIFFQIRPTADCFYKSSLEPWSHYLTGSQDSAPSRDFDPLDVVIREAHKRCMEVHAWFNPYRVLNSDNIDILSKKHLFYENPGLFKWYDKKLYFDPAQQLTRDYLTMIVMDVVLRYDVDAVHFDDYFYPYKVKGQEFPDDDSFIAENRGFKNKDDWRRDNVNLVIQQLQTAIKAAKPWVQFGIGPFGRYEYNYETLYADVLKWMKNGWIDYVVPQLYWEIGHKSADFKKLYDWWADEAEKAGCNFYCGLYASGLEIYKYQPWNKPNEVVRQLDFADARGADQGSVFYSSHTFLSNKFGLLDSLAGSFYRYPSLAPACRNMKHEASQTPSNVRYDKAANKLEWDDVVDYNEMSVFCYVVYSAEADEDGTPVDSKHILALTTDTYLSLDQYASKLDQCSKFYVTTINRLRCQSSISNVVSVE